MKRLFLFVAGCFVYVALCSVSVHAQTAVSTGLRLVDATTGYQLRFVVPVLSQEEVLTFPTGGGTLMTTGNAWALGGNTGVTGLNNIIGITDVNANPLRIFTNNSEAMQIDQNGLTGIGVAPVATYRLALNGNIRMTDATTSSIVGNKNVSIEQQGDTYGWSRLSLQHRTGSNGALFQTQGGASPDLVDFGFIPGDGPQSNIRLEWRGGSLRNSGNTAYGEFQYLMSSTGSPTFTLSVGSVSSSFENCNVSIGHANPSSKFTVGTTNQEFRVNSTGDLIRINNVPYTWPTSNAAANDYVLASTTGGTLTWVKPVTITVPSGRVTITGDGATTAFNISNAAITATSVIVYSVEDGTDLNMYASKISARAAGQFTVQLSAAMANLDTKIINYMVTNP